MKIKIDKLINSILVAGATLILVSMALCIMYGLPHIPEAEFYDMLSGVLTWAVYLIALWGLIKLSFFICDKTIRKEEKNE